LLDLSLASLKQATESNLSSIGSHKKHHINKGDQRQPPNCTADARGEDNPRFTHEVDMYQ